MTAPRRAAQRGNSPNGPARCTRAGTPQRGIPTARKSAHYREAGLKKKQA